jgi:ATP-dependent Clp protease ATP-binding subunit ClpA
MLTKKLAHLEFNLNLRLSVADRVRAHLLRTCFTQAEGARRLRQELDRQLNNAVLPWALAKRTPEEGCFYYEPKRDQLVLR